MAGEKRIWEKMAEDGRKLILRNFKIIKNNENIPEKYPKIKING
jgi:hypothetical protein